MLIHPTVDKLQQLRCAGMAKAFTEQLNAPGVRLPRSRGRVNACGLTS